MQERTKIVRFGSSEDQGNVYAKIELKVEGEKRTLSICGVEGPFSNGNCRGGCGQIVDRITDVTTYAPGWDRAKVARFAELWDRWHLNDMRPGCEHQRAEGWSDRPIDPDKPVNVYGLHFEGQSHASWNMLAWVTRKEHPEGLLSHPCETCGYEYGSKWVYESVPDAVLEEFASFPDTDKTPPWV